MRTNGLNKEVCKNCKNKLYKEIGFKFYYFSEWSKEDENKWVQGQVSCPYLRGDLNNPWFCRYKLEHLLKGKNNGEGIQ
jgi:hypothetical protein